jgi:hypothetical protein
MAIDFIDLTLKVLMLLPGTVSSCFVFQVMPSVIYSPSSIILQVGENMLPERFQQLDLD